MCYLLFTSQLKFSESTSPLFPTASLVERLVSLSTRKFTSSNETMTENIRGTLVYELICGIRACTVLVKQPPGLGLEPNPFISDSYSLLAPPLCKLFRCPWLLQTGQMVLFSWNELGLCVCRPVARGGRGVRMTPPPPPPHPHTHTTRSPFGPPTNLPPPEGWLRAWYVPPEILLKTLVFYTK